MDSSGWLRSLAIGQSPYAVANAAFAAASPASLFGIDVVGTSGLTLSLFGGVVNVGGVRTLLANQSSIAMTPSATNYVEFDPGGTGTTSGIRINTSGFTPGYRRLYTVVTNATAITSWIDYRDLRDLRNVRAVINMSSDANRTLTAAEQDADVIEITSITLTATRNVVVGLTPRIWIVANLSSGGQSLQFIGTTGTGVTVANGKRAIIYADGTNIVRATADNP